MNKSLVYAPPIVVVTFVTVLVGLRVSAATFSAPNLPEPGGNISLPLNTSSSPQTKAGGLTVEGDATIQNGLTLGQAGGSSKICWNDDGTGLNCRNNWGELSTVTGYLRLNSGGAGPADTGHIQIQGTSGSSDPVATVTVRAGTTTAPSESSYGVYGVAVGGVPSAISYGVLGQATVNSFQRAAIFGSSAGFPNAWAGYFTGGDVGVADQFDLAVGGTAVLNNTTQLCLNSTCIDSWPPDAGSGFWERSSSNLHPLDPTKSITVAGSVSTAPFHVAVISDGSPPDPDKADLTIIAGTAKFNQYIVGTPPPCNDPPGTCYLPAADTCGDGICSNKECDSGTTPGCTTADPNHCPADCDITPPDDVGVDTELEVCAGSGCPPPTPPTLYVKWTNPGNSDFAGTRVIVSSDRYPTGPTYIGDLGIMKDIAKPGTTYSAPCNLSTRYYAALYAYDQMGNFAPGILYDPLCTTLPVQ
ncbi:MAG: hypothetical protein HY420_02965 [Candidatus Kerfeldbacteria bacterium]|nr:hypothetical protein [Candidatus Kerfeldbacteria bacterium]